MHPNSLPNYFAALCKKTSHQRDIINWKPPAGQWTFRTFQSEHDIKKKAIHGETGTRLGHVRVSSDARSHRRSPPKHEYTSTQTGRYWSTTSHTAIARRIPPDISEIDSSLACTLRLIHRAGLLRKTVDTNTEKAWAMYKKDYDEHDLLKRRFALGDYVYVEHPHQ